MSRLIRSITLITAAVALALPAGLAATAATAATGPVTPTKEEAGYQFTGAQFRYAQATVYLRNASQYSASVAGLGQSVQFWGGGRVYVLGVSDSTTTSPYSPAVAVFNNSTHALVCATSNNTCEGTPASWTSGAVSYPFGHSVQETIFYNQGNGDLTFTVNDLTAHTSSGFTTNIGTGVSFKEVRIGTEFGNDPWSAPAFTAPAAQVKLAAFSGGQLTNYKGSKYGFSGYFTTSRLIMTGPGSVTEANAGPLNSTANGFSTFLVP
jgi:hypothetical protein